jgi:hypothetical protein
MHDRHKSTSHNPSSPNSAQDGAGPSDGGSPSGAGSRNAFDPDFLAKRHEREDEPLAAVEAESRGPWIVVETARPAPGGGRGSASYPERYEVYRSWEDPETDEPTATFRFREQAYLYAAALEVGARGSVLTLGREPTEKGYEVIQWDIQGRPEVVGHVAVYDEDVYPTFQKLETLLRAIEPLAQVLDAAGGVILELLGRRLMVE